MENADVKTARWQVHPPRLRLLFVAAFAATCLLISWAAMISMERAVVPETASPKSLILYLSDTPIDDTSALTPIHVELNKQPAYVYRDPERLEYSVFQHRFDAPEQEELGLYLSWARRIVEVRVNGTVLRQQTPTDLWGILGGFEPVAYVVPEDVIQEDNNILEIVNDGRSLKIAPELFISTPEDVLRAVGWGRMFSVDLAIGAIAVMLILIVIILTAHWPAVDRRRMRALAILLAMWSFRNLTFLGIDAAVPDAIAMLFHFLVTYLFIGAIAWFVVSWTDQNRWVKRAVQIGLALLVLVIIALDQILAARPFFQTAFWIEALLTGFVCIGGIYLLLAHLYRSEEPRFLQSGLFILALIAVAVDALDDKFASTIPFSGGQPITFYYAPMCGLFLALGLVATLAAQATAARRATENINETLREKLHEQELEIAASYERQQALEKESARAGERHRIMRDMHDGVGSLLLGLLVQIRSGKLSKKDIADGVEGGLNDLRLMITAMDGVGDDMGKALESFRERVQPQLDAAKVQLHWRNTLPDNLPISDTRTVLQIYRILQEALSNALRHAGAGKITIDASAVSFSELDIRVSDDGTGFDVDRKAVGIGLRNMEKRAKSLGADLNIHSDEDGSRIHLRVPLNT